MLPFQANAAAGVLVMPSEADWVGNYVDDGLVVEMPQRPNEHHVFDYGSKSWVDPRALADLQAAKWAEIKVDRDAAEFGGFEWQGWVFDSDQISQGRIAGAVQLARMDAAYQVDWTLADNSVVQLDAEQMQGVGAALGAHVSAQHSRARVLREEIYAPDMTAEALVAITFSTEG